MSFQTELKKTLNQLPTKFPKGADMLKHFTKQLQGYEEQLKELVSEFDSKSREARDKSQAQLDRLIEQVRKTRAQLEKRVTGLVETERKRLNENLNDFISFLKSVSQKEKPAARKKAPVKSSAKKSASSKKKKSTVARKVVKSKGSSEAHSYA